MGVTKKIEERTRQFIQIHADLKAAKKMVTHSDLAKIIGAESKTTITEIIKMRQNIQPEQWKRFKSHFEIKSDPESTEISDPIEPTDKNTEPIYRDKYLALLEKDNTDKDKMIDKLLVAVDKIQIVDDKVENIRSTVSALKGKFREYEPTILGLREFVTAEFAALKKKSREEVAAALNIKVEEQRQVVEQSYTQNS